MSYSFTVRAPNKTAAKAAVVEKFDQAVGNQKCHERDRAQALAAADAFVDLVADDDSKDVYVNMAGSLQGTWEGSDVTRISSANLSITAALMDRQAA